MNPRPVSISESLDEAKAVMATLEARASETTGSIDDRAELSVLRTTVSKLEELLGTTGEYHDILVRQLRRTNARIA